MATQKMNKYADYRYQIQSETELEEAKWLIEQGDFKDLEDYINCLTRAEIKWLKEQDAQKKKLTAARKNRRIETTKKNRAA